MKRLIFAVLIILFAGNAAYGQNTTVSGTITDTPDGQPWFGGTLSFVFRVSPSNPTAQYFFNGAPFSSSQTIAGALDPSGHYSASVPPNTSITPAGSTWDVTFCPLATAQCVTYQSVTVTGATQTFAPSPPSIRINLAVPLQNPRAYTDAEVVNGALGQSYFNLIISTIKLCNFFPCGWAVISGGGGNPANPVGSVQVNVAGSFGPGPQVSTVAINPQTNDNICYVSPNGNDANDGLGIGTGHAKLTIYSCLTTVLPGGTSTTAGNGTILISGFPSYGGPVTNQGFWLMGGTDPNFSSPPTGWLKTNASFPQTINFDCFATYLSEASGNTPRCGFLAGSNSPVLTPIWISGVAGNIAFNNLELNNFLGNYIRLGIDSNGNRNGLGGDSGIAFNNVGFNVGGCSSASTQKGPGIDIGSNTFWVWFRKLDGSGCPKEIFTVAASGAVRSSGVSTITTTATNDISTGELVTIANVPGATSSDDSFNGSFNVTVLDNTHFTYTNPGPNETSAGTGQVVTARTAAINIDPGTGPGSGLIYIDDANVNGGNIRFVPGTNGGGFYARNLSYEGGGSGSGIPDAPTFLITSTRTTSNAAGTNIAIDNVQVSDPNNINITPGVQVDNASAFPGLVTVRQVSSYVRGRMTVLDGTAIGPTNINPSATYLRQGQFGIRQGQITATGIDQARRGFSPVVAKATNLAATSPSSWTFVSGTGTVTPGINTTGLDGTNNAGRVTYSSGTPAAIIQFYGSSTALNLGDIYVFGVWARSSTNNGYSGNVPPIQFVFTASGLGSGDACVTSNISSGSVILGNIMGSQQSDGQWQWYSGLCKVLSNPTAPGTSFAGIVDSTHTTDFYAPTLYLFPSGTISDNEAYEIAINMASVPSSSVAGEVAMLPNQRLHHGTTTFANLGTPNNASDIYCTDCVVNSNPCVGTGTGAFAQGINGAWVCGGGGGGGGCAPGGITDALQYNGGGTCSFGGVNSPTVNGNYLVNYNVTASAAVPPTITIPGVPTNAQTGTTYTYLYSDRGSSVSANNSGAQTYTLVNPSASGFGSNYFNILRNIGTGAVTESASGFTINGGASLLVPPGWVRWLYSDGVNYFASRIPEFSAFPNCATAITFTSATGVFGCGAAGAVSSITGDGGGTGGIFSNVASTGAVTLTLNTTTANKVWANCTGSTATPTYCSITDAMLPVDAVLRNQANTYSGGGLQDFSAMVWKIPSGAGFTASATSNFGLDTTGKLFHCYLNNADAICSALSTISPATTSNTIGNGNNPQTWNWAQTSNTQSAMTFGETSAATNGTLTGSLANQAEVTISTASASTATPLSVVQGSVTGTVAFPIAQFEGTWNNASLVGKGLIVAITNTNVAAGSHIIDLLAGASGTTNEFNVDSAGNGTFAGNVTTGSLQLFGASLQANSLGSNVTVIGGQDTASAGTLGGFIGRGGNNTSTSAGATAGSATLRGGDETGATANATTGGAVTIRGGNSASTGTPTPGAVSVTGGTVSGAATNAQGAVVTIAGGLGTGNAAISNLKLQTPGFSTTSGTTAQAQVTRYVTHAKAGSTTSATATNMFNMPVATNQTIGVEVIVHVETTQATPQNCSTTETFIAAVQNTSSTVTQQTTAGTIATICSTGTLTLSSAFSAATPSVFSVTPSWTTIVPTAVIITVEIHNLSQQDISLL